MVMMCGVCIARGCFPAATFGGDCRVVCTFEVQLGHHLYYARALVVDVPTFYEVLWWKGMVTLLSGMPTIVLMPNMTV